MFLSFSQVLVSDLTFFKTGIMTAVFVDDAGITVPSSVGIVVGWCAYRAVHRAVHREGCLPGIYTRRAIPPGIYTREAIPPGY